MDERLEVEHGGHGHGDAVEGKEGDGLEHGGVVEDDGGGVEDQGCGNFLGDGTGPDLVGSATEGLGCLI